MGITLRVTPEKLEKKAGEVERYTEQLKTHFDNIQDIVSRTSGYWIGIAGDKARKEFESQKDDVETVIKRFREHPGDLLNMAGVYREAENSAKSQSEALKTDVIV